MKTQEKDTRGAKKPSADLESSKKKSQVDEAAAKTKGFMLINFLSE